MTVNINKIARFLGLVDALNGDRQREFETPLGQAKNQLDLENVALRNIELKRKLSEPTEYQQSQQTQEYEKQKYIFSTIKDLALDVRVPQATRNYYNSMMRAQYYSLTPEMQNILTPLLVNSPLDTNTQKAEFFNKYGDQPPEAPSDNMGDLLPRNQENVRSWAEYDIASSEYSYKRNLFLFGKDYASTQKLPRFYQPVEWVGEGESRRPGDLWYRDPDTQQITSLPATIADADLKKLEDWGWTMARIKKSGLRPVAEPIMATVGGTKVQITPTKDLITGQESYEVFSYDQTDESIKKLPPKILTALGELGRGADYDDPKAVKDGEVANIMRILTDFESAYGKEPTQEQLNGLNSRLQAYYPEMKGNRLVRIPKDKQGFIRRFLQIPGTEWSIIPTTATRNVIDRNGDPGTVFVDDESGRTFDAAGNEIMQSNVQQGDTIASIKFKPDIIAPALKIPTQEDIAHIARVYNISEEEAQLRLVETQIQIQDLKNRPKEVVEAYKNLMNNLKEFVNRGETPEAREERKKAIEKRNDNIAEFFRIFIHGGTPNYRRD